jgi:hypothetical protein
MISIDQFKRRWVRGPGWPLPSVGGRLTDLRTLLFCGCGTCGSGPLFRLLPPMLAIGMGHGGVDGGRPVWERS